MAEIIVDFFKTTELPPDTVPGDEWKVYVGDPGPEQVYLGTLAQLRAALAPNTLFLTAAPTGPGREGQLAYVTTGQLTDLWQYESGAWVQRLTGFVLGTADEPAVPLPVVALAPVQPGKVGQQLTLTATASVVGSTIAKVEFFDGATKIGEAASTPYATSYVPSAAGTHYFTAKATDANGRSSVSEVRSASISAAPAPSNQLPTVSLSLTPSDAIALGDAVTLSAVASDSDGTVAKVEFFDGATKVGEALASPYVLSYTPTTTGSRVLSAKATDNANGTATATKPLVVNAAAPTPTVPDAPVIGQATAGNATARVTWAAPASAGSSAITGYEVYLADSLTLLGTTSASTLLYDDNTAPNGSPRSFQVLAVNAVGRGPKSAASAPVTPTAPVPMTYNTQLSGPSQTEDATGITLTTSPGAKLEYDTFTVTDTTPKRMDLSVGGVSVGAVDMPASAIGRTFRFTPAGGSAVTGTYADGTVSL